LVISKGEIDSIYNIGNGVPLKMKDLIATSKGLLASKSPITSVPAAEFHKAVQVKSMYLDNKKLAALGYTPQYTTQIMLEDLVKSSL
jgi:nucleoside-diphosphate-sugar epimerase